MITREPIYQALFAFFAGLVTESGPLFKSATRSAAMWESYSPEEQPALLMVEVSEDAKHIKYTPTAWTLNIELWVYVHTGAAMDKTVIPAAVLNPLLDRIERVLQPDNAVTGECTFGGTVSSAAIHGTVQKYFGSLGDEAVIKIPIRILTTV